VEGSALTIIPLLRDSPDFGGNNTSARFESQFAEKARLLVFVAGGILDSPPGVRKKWARSGPFFPGFRESG
jgi:hypothetical protein